MRENGMTFWLQQNDHLTSPHPREVCASQRARRAEGKGPLNSKSPCIWVIRLKGLPSPRLKITGLKTKATVLESKGFQNMLENYHKYIRAILFPSTTHQ